MIRKFPLINDQIYHVFNRSINGEPVFQYSRECRRAILSLEYYSFVKSSIRLSHFLEKEFEKKQKFLKMMIRGKRRVDILSYCLMPNHFHLILKQAVDDGIKEFLSLFQNSFTRYYNTKQDRIGPIFQGYFKSILVETDEQLIHLSRYVHLNPYSSHLVETLDKLESYQWSSLQEYFQSKKGICHKDIILSLFDHNAESYKRFVFDQADYQRRLNNIKHLTGDYQKRKDLRV